MNVIQVNNWARGYGGIEVVVDATMNLLKHRRIDVSLIARYSEDLPPGLWGKMRAFVSGIYSVSEKRLMESFIQRQRPDVMHLHSLYPLFSPSVLVACQRAGVPVVLTCHSYYLTCPTLFHFENGKICERCCGGREYWCINKNCRGNIFESIGYSLRSAVARWLQLFHKNVTLIIALTEFANNRLVDAGFQEEYIVVVPNMVSIPDSAIDPSIGRYAAFAGRMSPEKGVDTLLAAAAMLPEIPVRFAGDGPIFNELIGKAPDNAKFAGLLDTQKIAVFYRNARFLILPSIWFEMCPLVISEAMSHGLPVIASRIGGIPEIVEDGVTGLLFEPGNAKDLAEKMKLLWENPDLCRRMGQAGREKAIREYSEDVYYRRLMGVYERAIELNKEMRTRGKAKHERQGQNHMAVQA